MFLYVAALAVMFLCQSGVTGFIQAPAKAPRATTKATWGAPRLLARPLGWDLGDDSLGWAASKDDGGGSPSDDPTPSMNLSDGDDVALARRRRARAGRALGKARRRPGRRRSRGAGRRQRLAASRCRGGSRSRGLWRLGMPTPRVTL